MLEPGRLTLATGEVVSFVDDYVAFTSNLGSAEAMRMSRSSPTSVEQAILRRVAEALRPEILARIPDKLVFSRLTPDVQREIAELHLAAEVGRLRTGGFDLEVSREALEFLIREGFHPHLGARPLRQTIERQLQDAVARSLLAHGIGSGRIDLGEEPGRLTLLVT
jgi:ATP-dependent Clp protease ATP-binding subunit ClpB